MNGSSARMPQNTPARAAPACCAYQAPIRAGAALSSGRCGPAQKAQPMNVSTPNAMPPTMPSQRSADASEDRPLLALTVALPSTDHMTAGTIRCVWSYCPVEPSGEGMAEHKDLSGRVVAITGVARGIGLATAG